MNWFYAYQGQRAGPVDDEEFARLVGDGTVGETTLVWHGGMPDWMPFSQARATAAMPPPATVPTTGASTGLSPVPAYNGTYQAQCTQCGRVFPADEVIRLEGFNVCAECKPLLLQKMRQGMSPAQGAWGIMPARFGGFWIRWGAIALDVLIMSPLLIALWFAGMYLTPSAAFYTQGENILPYIGYQLLNYGVLAAYEIFFVGRYAATPGKMICGLRVVRGDGSKVTYGRATGRFFARFLTKFTLYIGYLIAAFDDQKRTLHDHVCDTRVVFKD